MRNSSKKNTEQDTRRRIAEDVRDIMRSRSSYDDEEGPSLIPGLEDSGIGSIHLHEEALADEFEEDARFERALEEMDDEYDEYDDYDDEEDQEEELPEPEEEFDARDLTEEEIRNLKPVGRGPYLFISWAFVLIFVLLAGQMVYFNLYQKDAILDSPYNKRQNTLSDHVRRGKIISSDGSVLAYSETDDEGKCCEIKIIYRLN